MASSFTSMPEFKTIAHGNYIPTTLLRLIIPIFVQVEELHPAQIRNSLLARVHIIANKPMMSRRIRRGLCNKMLLT